jgi:uncharacterized OsmC-like protein
VSSADAEQTSRPVIDLARIRAAHEERGVAMREPDADRRIITRAKVRTAGNLLKEARVGKFTFQSDEAAMLGGDDSAPNPLAYFVASIGFCLLTQLTRACALEDLPIESIEMDVRASFPLESKYGISDVSAACDQVTYTVEVTGEVDPSDLMRALAWSESVCHVVRSLKEPVPVEMALKLNGEFVPAT